MFEISELHYKKILLAISITKKKESDNDWLQSLDAGKGVENWKFGIKLKKRKKRENWFGNEDKKERAEKGFVRMVEIEQWKKGDFFFLREDSLSTG